MRALAAAVLMVAIGVAGAQEKARTALDEYHAQSSFHKTLCSFRSGDPKCIADGQKALKAAYDLAAKALKKASAKAALKDHYVAASGALAGVAPSAGERQFSYDQRQGEAERRLQELWTRFELER